MEDFLNFILNVICVPIVFVAIIYIITYAGLCIHYKMSERAFKKARQELDWDVAKRQHPDYKPDDSKKGN